MVQPPVRFSGTLGQHAPHAARALAMLWFTVTRRPENAPDNSQVCGRTQGMAQMTRSADKLELRRLLLDLPLHNTVL